MQFKNLTINKKVLELYANQNLYYDNNVSIDPTLIYIFLNPILNILNQILILILGLIIASILILSLLNS